MANGLDDESLKAIGRITVEFSFLETAIALCIWVLIRDLGFGMVITAQMSCRNLIDLLDAVFRHKVKDKGQHVILDDLLKRAVNAEEKRNQVIHSLWTVGKTPGTIVRSKSTKRRGKGVQRDEQIMSVDELNTVADLIAEVGEEFRTFSVNVPKRKR